MRFKQVCSQRLSLILGLQFLMGVVFSSFSFADTSSPWIELARYDLDHEGRVTCDYAKMIHTYLQSVPESDLLKGLQEERTRLEALKLDTPAEKRIRARALRDIHKILKQSQLRPALFERNQRLCEGALQAGRSTVHALSLGLSAIDSVFLFPIRLLTRFGIGVFTGKPLSQQAPLRMEQIIGTQNMMSAATMPLSTTIGMVINGSASPYTLPFMIIPIVDALSAIHCNQETELTIERKKFCEQYRKMKSVFTLASRAAQPAGTEVHDWFIDTFDFRSNHTLNDKVCNKDPRQQIKIAHRAVLRVKLDLKAISSSIHTVKIIPPQPHGCVSLRVVTKNLDDTQLLDVDSKLQDLIGHYPDGLAVDSMTQAEDDELSKQPDPFVFDETNETVCESLHQTKVQKAMNQYDAPALGGMDALFRLMINADDLTKPVGFDVVTPSDKLLQSPVEQMGTGRNVILQFGPTPEELKIYESLKPEFKKKQKELKQYSAIKKQLMAADSVEECKSLLSKSTFDYRQFVKLNLQLAEYDPKKEVEKYIIEKKSYKQSSKLYGVIPLMRKKWEWITTSSFDDLIQLLQDPQLENLIISEHGASNGYIMDLKEHQMPLELLKAKLSPRLQTLAFFSCHGDKIKDLYKIQENLLKQESVHALRKVLWLPATEVVPGFSKEGEVVVQLLGPFIKKVDHAIRKLEKGNQRAQVLAGYQFKKDSLDSSRCQIVFSHLEKNQPWFAVKLNEALISVWEPSGVAKPLSFSCKELVEGKNTLRIYNITMDFEKVGLLSTLATATNESAFQIQGLSTTQRIDQVRWMPKKVEADGKMQGLVLEFNLINSQIP